MKRLTVKEVDDDVLYFLVFKIGGAQKMRRSKLKGPRLLPSVDVHRDDSRGPRDATPLYAR